MSEQAQAYQTPTLEYASYLKSVYTQEKSIFYNKWPQVKSKKYINLALIEKEDITKQEAHQFMRAMVNGKIDDIKKSKRAMDISQIAQLPDGSQPKCILVEGAPGVGKSTFAWKLCHKWRKGKLLQQYQLVVLLRLRDESVRATENISDLFQCHDHQIQQAAVEEIQRTGGKGVLLLFEGYDELPEELRTDNSVFLDVITGEELPEATVLITSRPWASEFLRRECKEQISQHIEILGFTKANIQSYLESTIPDDPSLLAGLKKYISCYPHIGSLMYIPLNSAIVVEVYRNSRKDDTLVPKTMTELYSSLVRDLLLRHLLDHPVHGRNRRWRVRSFSDLPQDVYQQLCELGRIAYEGILHDQQVIFSDLPEDFETLGLMHCAPALYVDEGAVVSYNFLHLTVQEYLAAFHLSQQPVEKQIKHFREYKEDIKQYMSYKKEHHHHFHMVLRFLCGIRKFSGYSSDVLNTQCVENSGYDTASDDPDVESGSGSNGESGSDSNGESGMDTDGESGDDSVSDNSVLKVTFNTLHWLFEAQNNDVIAKLLRTSDIQLLEDSDRGVTPFDCFVLGYCVSHSNCTWSIFLVNCNIDNEGVEMLMRGAVEEETNCTGQISTMILCGNQHITAEGMKHLLGIPNKLISKLETLNLFKNDLNPDSCEVLADFIQRVPHLKRLYLSDNPSIGHGTTVTLMTSLIAHISLEHLSLSGTGSGVKECQALSELLSLSLKKLDISWNALPQEAIELIIKGLCRDTTTLEELNMRGSHFSLQNTTSLASVLRTNRTLVYLDLEQCNIGPDGACQLASALRTNDKLQMLNLGCNPIEVEGAATLAEMLLHNTSLKVLAIRHNSIGEEGTQKLIDSLTHNFTMEKLALPVKYESSTNSPIIDSRIWFSEYDFQLVVNFA